MSETQQNDKLYETKFHIEECDLGTLYKVKAFVDETIARKKDEQLAAFRADEYALRVRAAELGIPYAGAKPQKQPSEPKYRNPANPEQTWSGLGKQPNWIKDQLASGAALASMLIETPATADAEAVNTPF